MCCLFNWTSQTTEIRAIEKQTFKVWACHVALQTKWFSWQLHCSALQGYQFTRHLTLGISNWANCQLASANEMLKSEMSTQLPAVPSNGSYALVSKSPPFDVYCHCSNLFSDRSANAHIHRTQPVFFDSFEVTSDIWSIANDYVNCCCKWRQGITWWKSHAPCSSEFPSHTWISDLRPSGCACALDLFQLLNRHINFVSQLPDIGVRTILNFS